MEDRQKKQIDNNHIAPTLVLGATGKTGRRVAAQLQSQGIPVRLGSRSADPKFDWAQESTWTAALAGVQKLYLNYAPDLALPGATDTIQAFVDHAKTQGLKHITLISGRGEAEAQACERIVQESGLQWTVVRAGWFNQNFSEGAFVDMVHNRNIALPGAGVPEPWVDVDDIAETVVASLVDSKHAGEVYEVTGPRVLHYSDIAEALSDAIGESVRYTEIPHEAFVQGIKSSGAPKDVVWLMDYLFSTVLDGRNAHVADGIERALGRPPKDFRHYARDVAATKLWEGGSK